MRVATRSTLPLTAPPAPGVASFAVATPTTTLTYTFDPLMATPRDRVRDAIGDRDMSDPLRSDQEIDARLVQLGDDERLTVAVIAEGLASEYARRVDSYSESGGISVRWGERVKRWLDLAQSIRDEIAAETFGSSSNTVEAVAIRASPYGYVSEYVRN